MRRKIRIAVFPLTCRIRDRVGRSENLFIFHYDVFVLCSLLKICIKGG